MILWLQAWKDLGFNFCRESTDSPLLTEMSRKISLESESATLKNSIHACEESATKPGNMEWINLVHLFIYGLCGKMGHKCYDSGRCFLLALISTLVFKKLILLTYICT